MPCFGQPIWVCRMSAATGMFPVAHRAAEAFLIFRIYFSHSSVSTPIVDLG